MYSHVMIGANDMDASKQFYDAVFSALGYGPGQFDPKGRCFYVTETGIFAITAPIDGEPATHGNGSTIGFNAISMGNAYHCNDAFKLVEAIESSRHVGISFSNKRIIQWRR